MLRLYRSFLLSVAAMPLLASAAFAQAPAAAPPPALVPQGHDPRPVDAERGLIDAFDRYDVVAMSAGHGNKDLDDFILHLVRNPAFAIKVNDIVVECGNSRYQPVLDRYIAGEDVPPDEVRKVWRDTSQSMCGLSAFYAELFPLIRRINKSLPADRKLRVVAGDPPLDWAKINTVDEWMAARVLDREPSITSVMRTEVLSRHRKALMLFGTAHISHASNGPGPSAVEMYEAAYPGVTLVVADHNGFGTYTPFEAYNGRFEARLASWPRPSLVLDVKGTWLADLIDRTTPESAGRFFVPMPGGKPPEGAPPMPPKSPAKFADRVDAYLYLGPRDQLLKEPVPAVVVLDPAYMAELKRRAALLAAVIGDNPISYAVEPAAILAYDANLMAYGAD